MISLLRPGLLMALLAGWAPLVLSQQGAERFNMDFRLGFFPGLDPRNDPTQEELDGLICATQVFLAKVLQNTTQDNTVTIQARDISVQRDIFNPEKNDTQMHITFWGNFSTAEGGTPPTRDQVIAAFDINNPAFNATEYIVAYAASSTPLGGGGNYFFDVDSMEYNGTYGLPRAGQFEQAICEITEAPTYPPTNCTEDCDGDDQGDNTDPGDQGENGDEGDEGDGSGGPEGDGAGRFQPPDPSLFGNGTFAPGAPTPAPGPLFGNGTFSPDAYGNGTFNPELLETDAPTSGDDGDRPPVTGSGDGVSPFLEPDEDEFANGTFAPGAPTPAPGDYFGNGTFSPEAYSGGTFNPDLFGDATPNPDGEIPVDEDTQAPSAGNSAPNTNDMVYFTLQYRFGEGEAEEPTEDAVKSLICKTNLFIRDELRNHTGDDTLQAEATNINWNYDGERFEEFEMSFTANVTSNDYQDTVPLQTVFDGMEVSREDILRYIEFYIWESEPTLYWQEIVASNFTNEAQVPIPIGRLDRYDCPATEAPSSAPTVSPAPTSSNAPSAFPTVSPAPTVSKAPSLSPTISPAPTARPPTNNRPVSGEGQGIYNTDAPTGPLMPTISAAPTISPAPTNSPTVSAAPTITPMPTIPGGGSGGASGNLGPATRQKITTKFLVSNIDDITEPAQVSSRGLDQSWPVFASEVVQNITDSRTAPTSKRFLRATSRRLAVGLEPGSASVELVEPVECPEGSHSDAECHNATASYVLLLRGDEDPGNVQFEYGTETIAAVDDGRYQAVLDRVDPDSPIVIGKIPEPEGKKGTPLWLIILIVLLCLLCCLCILFAIFFMMRKGGDEDKQLEPYDEEGFVYDFLIPPNEKPQTEVDDDATKAVDMEGEDDEEFNDDPDEDKEEFDEDDARNLTADPSEEEAEVEEEANLENLEDIDGSEGELSEGEKFDDEDDAARALEPAEEEEDEPIALLAAPEPEEEAPPSSDEEEAPEPVEESSEHEEPPAAAEEQWDDEAEPEAPAEAEPEPEASEEAGEEAGEEPELADVASDGEPEAAGSGGEEGWDDDQEGGEADAAEEEGWDEDGSGGEAAAAEAEEWDDDNAAEAGGEEENWDDEEGAPEAAGSDDGWDDEAKD